MEVNGNEADQHFRIEMEMTGLTRRSAADIIAKHFHIQCGNKVAIMVFILYCIRRIENGKSCLIPVFQRTEEELM